MKKLLLTTLIIGALAGSVFAQGLVSLSGKAYYNTVQGTTAGTAIPVATVAQVGTWGQMNVALVYSPTAAAGLFGATTAGSLTGDWVQALGIDSKITSPVAGTLALTTMTVGAATPEETFVVGWTGTYLTWNAAWAGDTRCLHRCRKCLGSKAFGKCKPVQRIDRDGRYCQFCDKGPQ